jgi:hypothetical protein
MKRKGKVQRTREESVEEPKYLGDVLELLEGHKSDTSLQLTYQIRISSTVTAKNTQQSEPDMPKTISNVPQVIPNYLTNNPGAHPEQGKDKAHRCADLITSRIWETLGYCFM